jgi:hypothetical protein
VTDLSSVPEGDRDRGAAALDAAFGDVVAHGFAPVAGGASGARAWRVATSVGEHCRASTAPICRGATRTGTRASSWRRPQATRRRSATWMPRPGWWWWWRSSAAAGPPGNPAIGRVANGPFIDLATLCGHVVPPQRSCETPSCAGAPPARSPTTGPALGCSWLAHAVERAELVAGERRATLAFAAAVLRAVLDLAESGEGRRALTSAV